MTQPAEETVPRVIDVHVHLAGLGAGNSGCHVSARMRRTLVYHILRRVVKLDPDDPGADAVFADNMARFIAGAPHVDAGVVFAMDGVYDAGVMVREKSHLYVPNEYLFATCRKHSEMLPGPSINPSRRDALEELDRCDGQGAVLVKWLPPLQHFDPADRAFDRFYEELARRGLPLLAHTGCEHTFPEMAQQLGQPARYVRALEAGVTLIFAHCGVGCRFHRDCHHTPEVLKMMQRFPNLHADTSALASLLKFQHLRRIPFADFPGRFLHGSDYPIPPLAIPFVGALGLARALKLTFHKNAFEVDWQIKTAIGMPGEVFTNASRVLGPRIRKWQQLRQSSLRGSAGPR